MTVASKLRLRAKYHRRRARQLSAEAGATARMWSGSMTEAKAGALGRLLADAYVHSDRADEYEHGITSGWADRAGAALIYALERAGWELLSVEIDTHRETARIEIKGFDGKLLTLDARDGRASITREMVEWRTDVIGRRGDRCRVDRLGSRFIGRTRHEGFRSAMRSLSHYLADNAPRATLPRETSRRLLAPLCDGWGEREVA